MHKIKNPIFIISEGKLCLVLRIREFTKKSAKIRENPGNLLKTAEKRYLNHEKQFAHAKIARANEWVDIHTHRQVSS